MKVLLILRSYKCNIKSDIIWRHYPRIKSSDEIDNHQLTTIRRKLHIIVHHHIGPNDCQDVPPPALTPHPLLAFVIVSPRFISPVYNPFIHSGFLIHKT